LHILFLEVVPATPRPPPPPHNHYNSRVGLHPPPRRALSSSVLYVTAGIRCSQNCSAYTNCGRWANYNPVVISSCGISCSRDAAPQVIEDKLRSQHATKDAAVEDAGEAAGDGAGDNAVHAES
jgi:hypothetical protein